MSAFRRTSGSNLDARLQAGIRLTAQAVGPVPAAVQHGTAVGTDEVCDAGRLAAGVFDPSGRRRAVAQRTVAGGSDPCCSCFLRENPRPHLERRSVTDVLVVATIELRHPVAIRILTQPDDHTLHDGTLPSAHPAERRLA